MFVPDGRLPEEEHTLTIRPQPRSAMTGAAARIRRIGAITWSSHWACQSSSVSSSSEQTALVPAPLTRASIRPNRSSTPPTIERTADSSVRSAWKPKASAPCSLKDAMVSAASAAEVR